MPDVTLGALNDSGILSLGDGYRTKRPEHGRPGFRILRVADVNEGRIRPDGDDFVRTEFARAIGSKLSQPGDVLLTTKGTVGRVAIFPADVEQVVYSPQLCYFRVRNESVILPRYLAYWFKSESFRKQASHRANNTDMAAYINLRDIRSLRVALPSADQQQAIAEVLGALDDKIAANDRLMKLTRELLSTYFRALRIDDEPANDPEMRLSDLVELNPSLRVTPGTMAPYLDMKNLPQDAITVSVWSHRTAQGGARFQNGDTLLARITPCLENGKVGFVDFLRADETGVGSTEFIVMRPRNKVPKAWPYFLATSDRFREYAIRHMAGTTGRQRLAASDVGSFTLPQPDEKALRAFAVASDSLLPRIKGAVVESNKLAAARDELLPLLMSGRVRVRDAEKVVEGAL